MKRKRTEPTQDQVAQTPIIHTIHHVICDDKPRVKLWHPGFLIGIQAPPLLGKFSVWANCELVGSSDEYGRFLFRDSQMPRAVTAVGPAQDYIACDTLEIEFDHQTFYHMAGFCKGRDPAQVLNTLATESIKITIQRDKVPFAVSTVYQGFDTDRLFKYSN